MRCEVRGTYERQTHWSNHYLVSVRIYLSTHPCLELTCAGLHALSPSVLRVSATGASTVLVPSTTSSATTDSAGFLKRAALWASHRISDRWGDGLCAGWGSGYELSFRDWPTISMRVLHGGHVGC